MVEMKRISIAERNIFLFLFNKGISLREISRITGRSYTSVRYTIFRYTKAENLKPKLKTGRPCVLNHKERNFIYELLKNNCNLNARQVQIQVCTAFRKNVGIESIRRIIRYYTTCNKFSFKKRLLRRFLTCNKKQKEQEQQK